jgi:hypothetical protein
VPWFGRWCILAFVSAYGEKNNRCCSGGCGGDGAGNSVHVGTGLNLVEEGPVYDSGGCRGEGGALAGVLALT